MPSFRHHDFGNLYVQFAVKFPDKTELRNLEQLENVLPPRMVQAPPPADSMVDDYDIEDVDARGHARAQGAAGLGEDDDDDVPPGAERMQCASQ
jgi:DnaJ homolog subfamily A member 2